MREAGRSSSKAAKAGGAGGLVIVLVVLLVQWLVRQQAPIAGPAGGTTATSAEGAPAERVDSRAARAPRESVASRPETLGARGAPASRRVRIGSWNIEWLGKPEERSGRAAGVAQRPEDLAAYILFARVSAIALQEIVADASGDSPRSSALDAALSALEREGGGNWEYLLFESRREGDQRTGVAWDRSVWQREDAGGRDGSGWRVPIREGRSASGSGLWNRPPHAVKLSAGAGLSDVVLIPLHMKSDFDGSFAEHRLQEARALLAALDVIERTMGDEDVVLLGDTNITSGDEGALRAIAGAGFIDLNASSARTHWRGGSMDRIFTPAGQREFEGARFEVAFDSYLRERAWRPEEFKQRLSDHAMVIMEFEVTKDDD